MLNPFELIVTRLSYIETLLVDLKKASLKEVPSSNEEDLMTVEETALFLNLTIPTIYSKTCKAELPFMKRGKRIYFSRKELMDYLKQGRHKTFAEMQSNPEAFLKTKRNRRA